jgi:hypothetical protein
MSGAGRWSVGVQLGKQQKYNVMIVATINLNITYPGCDPQLPVTTITSAPEIPREIILKLVILNSSCLLKHHNYS